MKGERLTNQHSENLKRVNELSKLSKEIGEEEFPQIILKQSIFDLIYILEEIEKAIEHHLKDYTFLGEEEIRELFRSTPLIRFYSQCLLLWGFRILEILEETSGLEIPPDIRIARDVLVAHFGIARGNLKKKLSIRKIVIYNPKISPNGNLTYNLSSLGGPASLASPTELLEIKQLYKKYCPEESEPNIWEICQKLLRRNNVKIKKEDISKINKFLRNNGGSFTTSHRLIDFIINSLKQYKAKIRDK